jgi:hypothetical protein
VRAVRQVSHGGKLVTFLLFAVVGGTVLQCVASDRLKIPSVSLLIESDG